MTKKLEKSGFIMFSILPLLGILLLVGNGNSLIGSTVTIVYTLGGIVPFYLYILITWLVMKPKTTQQLNFIVLFSPLGTAAIYLVLLFTLGLSIGHQPLETIANLSAGILLIIPVGYAFVLLYFLLFSKRSSY